MVAQMFLVHLVGVRIPAGLPFAYLVLPDSLRALGMN